MKRRSIAIFTVGIISAVIILIWSQHHRSRLSAASQAKVAAMRAEVSPVPSEVPRPVREEREQSSDEERKRVVIQAIEKTNVPIKFWGKVVDQDEKPIDRVTVLLSYSTEHGDALGTAWGQQQIHKGRATTDAGGLFVISGITGHAIAIDALQKEGYKHADKGAKTYNYYGDTSSGKFIANADKPVVFVMTNDAMAERLVVYGGDFGKTIRVAGNGTPLRWNVWQGQADPNGELQITLIRTPAVVERVGQVLAWSARLQLSAVE